MQRTNFGGMACSIARTLDVIGEPWSPLVLRDVWAGLARFEQIQADLGISRKVLTERLNHLVDQDVLARGPRRPVLSRPPACGEASGLDLRCAHCGEPMHANDVNPLPGPGPAV